MNEWSLTAECLSFILLVVLMMSFYSKTKTRSGLFGVCLWLTMSSILLNIISVHTIASIQVVPLWVNYLVNSAYFYVTVLMCTALSYYMFQRILEFVYEKHCMRRANVGLGVIQGIYTLIVLWNLSSGVLFYFDEAGRYQRGPLNQIGYQALGAELVMLMICYARNRKSAGSAVVRLMWMMPPIVALMALFQLSYPEQLLNGTISVLTDLAIYISFQDYYIEQDSLTRVGNRKSAVSELALRTNGRQQYQVILVGLKQFGRINRQFGHSVGDALLAQIAARLNVLLERSRAFRTSNVEFALICACRTPQEAYDNLEKIRALFERDWVVREKRCHLDIRVAELFYHGQEWDPGQVIEYVEYAFQLAKEEKRPLVRFDGKTAQRYQRREFLTETLRRAILDRRFEVWYQPVYHQRSRSFASAEALLRLRDYDGKPVSPGEFVPILESEGMLDEVSWLVLDLVCRLLGSGEVPGLSSVSINLSMQQFMRPDLLKRIEDSMERYGVQPEQLKLEVTERVMLEDMERTKEIMAEMTRHRLGFYMDDFGTGYSNLSSVLELPFEVVKLDRSLLCGLPEDRRACLLAESLISTFHRLGQVVVAEGVENSVQAQRIKDFGADRIQGYYYARPMPEADFVALFQKQVKDQSL